MTDYFNYEFKVRDIDGRDLIFEESSGLNQMMIRYGRIVFQSKVAYQ